MVSQNATTDILLQKANGNFGNPITFLKYDWRGSKSCKLKRRNKNPYLKVFDAEDCRKKWAAHGGNSLPYDPTGNESSRRNEKIKG